MSQYSSNLTGVMDVKTISKNGVSSKIQMSRGNLVRKACFFLLVVFSLCSCDEVPEEEIHGKIPEEMLGTWHLKKHEKTDADMRVATEIIAYSTFTLYNDRTYNGIPCSTVDYYRDEYKNNTWKFTDDLFEMRDAGGRTTYRATLKGSELIIETLEEWDWYGKWTYTREPVQLPPFPTSNEIASYKGDISLLHGTWLVTGSERHVEYEDKTPEYEIIQKEHSVESFIANNDASRASITVNSNNSFLIPNFIDIITDGSHNGEILMLGIESDFSDQNKTLFTFNSETETFISPNTEIKYTVEAASNSTTLIISGTFSTSEKFDISIFYRYTFTKK